MFNKYSSKCLSYILKNKYFKLTDNKKMDKIIDDITNTLKDLYNNKEINLSNINKILIPKIQIKNSIPLVFKLLKIIVNNNEIDKIIKLGKKDTVLMIKTLKEIIDKNNIEKFYEWYNKNIDKMNTINCLLSKTRKSYNKEINKLLEELGSDEKRKPINNLLYNNSFISIDIHYFAETNDLLYYNYNSDEINLHIYSLKELDINFIKNLVLIYHMISKICKKKANGIDIRILLSPNRKRIKSNNQHKILCCQNVNSGSTLTGSYINLWRKEEIEKVYIHELIHCLGIDEHSWYNNDYKKLINNIKETYNINGEIRPFEAYTDSIAIIFHTIYVGFKLLMKKKDIYKMLSLEISFILFQAAKVLNYYGFEKIDDLINSDKFINQNTSVFSYYIIKASILYNIENYLLFLNDTFSLEDRIKEFDNIINKYMIDKSFKDIINKYINLIKKEDNNRYIFYNLRMSSIQI